MSSESRQEFLIYALCAVFIWWVIGHRNDDARIIAAAPDMVEMLRKCQNQVGSATREEIGAIFDAHGIDL